MHFQLETWWEEVVYMEGRLPNPLINMTGPGPYVSDVWKPRLGTKIPRSALMLHYMVHFWLLTRWYVSFCYFLNYLFYHFFVSHASLHGAILAADTKVH